MQIYPEAEPFTHLAKVPFGVKQYSFSSSFLVSTIISFLRDLACHSQDPSKLNRQTNSGLFVIVQRINI